MIDYKISNAKSEVFTQSVLFRWLIRSKAAYKSDVEYVHEVKVLQQAWQGDKGSVDWLDVPIVHQP